MLRTTPVNQINNCIFVTRNWEHNNDALVAAGGVYFAKINLDTRLSSFKKAHPLYARPQQNSLLGEARRQNVSCHFRTQSD